MDHQDWTPIIIGRKEKKSSNTNTSTIVNSTHLNQQKKPVTHATKIEQKMEEGTFDLPKVTHNLQQQIQQARQSKNWTQKQLAQACNITESVVKNYESGKAVPAQQDLDKMSRALGVRLKNK
ncbi:helix-turn-helix protein [Indivirus ILV1]|uniref:Helix-turn-helix protein n=1 Tax=Indivirus ILV1 TaxID=1977633 RepID=A0A1V0SDB8_9VIRU|nr:helix-turn-helix protein [Indivirus ILV1]